MAIHVIMNRTCSMSWILLSLPSLTMVSSAWQAATRALAKCNRIPVIWLCSWGTQTCHGWDQLDDERSFLWGHPWWFMIIHGFHPKKVWGIVLAKVFWMWKMFVFGRVWAVRWPPNLMVFRGWPSCCSSYMNLQLVFFPVSKTGTFNPPINADTQMLHGAGICYLHLLQEWPSYVPTFVFRKYAILTYLTWISASGTSDNLPVSISVSLRFSIEERSVADHPLLLDASQSASGLGSWQHLAHQAASEWADDPRDCWFIYTNHLSRIIHTYLYVYIYIYMYTYMCMYIHICWACWCHLCYV